MKIMFSLLIVLSLIFAGCCWKDDPENISNGTVVDENTIAETDSLAQILQTWVPEVPVDSVEHCDEYHDRGDEYYKGLWHEIYFHSEPVTLLKFFSEDGLNACVIKIFEKENGLHLKLNDVFGLKNYTQLLNLSSGTPLSTERFDILYSDQGLKNKIADSTRFAEHCADKNAQLEIEKSYEEELHLRCTSVVDSVVAANDYLRMNGEKLKSYCESVEWGN